MIKKFFKIFLLLSLLCFAGKALFSLFTSSQKKGEQHELLSFLKNGEDIDVESNEKAFSPTECAYFFLAKNQVEKAEQSIDLFKTSLSGLPPLARDKKEQEIRLLKLLIEAKKENKEEVLSLCRVLTNGEIAPFYRLFLSAWAQDGNLSKELSNDLIYYMNDYSSQQTLFSFCFEKIFPKKAQKQLLLSVYLKRKHIHEAKTLIHQDPELFLTHRKLVEELLEQLLPQKGEKPIEKALQAKEFFVDLAFDALHEKKEPSPFSETIYRQTEKALEEQHVPNLLFFVALEKNLSLPEKDSLFQKVILSIFSKKDKKSFQKLSGVLSYMMKDEEALSFFEQYIAKKARQSEIHPSMRMAFDFAKKVLEKKQLQKIEKELTRTVVSLFSQHKKYDPHIQILFVLSPESKKPLTENISRYLIALFNEKKITPKMLSQELTALKKYDLQKEILDAIALSIQSSNESDPKTLIDLLALEKETGHNELQKKLASSLSSFEEAAQHSLKEKNYRNCRDLVALIGSIDEKNEKAPLLEALSLFKEHKYEEALEALDKVDIPLHGFETYKEALELLLSKKDKLKEKLETILKKGNSFSLETALLLLEEEAYDLAFLLIEQLKETKEGALLLPLLLFEKGEIDEALKQIKGATEPLLSLKLQAAIEKKDFDKAKELLQNAQVTSLDPSLHPKVLQFLKEIFSSFSMQYARAIYSNRVMNNPLLALEDYTKMENLSPKAHYEKVALLLELGFFEKAEKELNSFLEKAGKSLYKKLARAEYLLATNDLLGAEKILRPLSKKEGMPRSIYKLNGHLLQLLGKHDLAEKQFQALFKDHEDDIDSLIEQARSIVMQKNLVDTFSILTYLEKQPLNLEQKIKAAHISVLCKNHKPLQLLWQEVDKVASPRAFIALIDLLEHIGALQGAKELLEGNEKATNGIPALLLSQARIYTKLGEKEKADQILKKLESKDALFLMTKEPFLASRGDTDRLEKQFKKYQQDAGKESALKVFTLFPKIDFLFELQEKHPELIAEEEIQLLMQRYSSLVEIFCFRRKDLGEPLYYHARFLIQNEERSEAKRFLQQALAMTPSLAKASWQIGILEAKEGDFFHAQKALEEALFFLPGEAPLWLDMAHVAIRAKDLPTSRFCIEEALKIKPDNKALLLEISSLLIKLQSPESAIGHLRKLLQKEPNNFEALSLLYKAFLDPVISSEHPNIEEERAKIKAKLYSIDKERAEKLLE